MAHNPTLPFQRRLLPDGYGLALRAAREGRGETRRQVAAAVGIQPRTLARIERETQTPLWPTLDALCGHLGIGVGTVARRWLRDSLDVPGPIGSAPGPGLRALREARGMTLVQLEDLTGVSAATISRFERGLTASRLLASRVGGPEVDPDDRDVLLDSQALAEAFDLRDAAALRAACRAAAREAAARARGAETG